MLDTRTRASIYQKLVPLLGEDDANALMSELPLNEGDQLVTKSFLRAELGDLRSELRAEIGGLRSELRAEIGDLRSELHSEVGSLRSDLASLETRLTLRMGAVSVALASLMIGLKLFG